MDKKRVLIGSPVYQKPSILKEFLSSIERLNQDTISLDCMFVDDNRDACSKELLSKFTLKHASVFIVHGEELGEYLCDDETHHWNDDLMLKVANYKNSIIDYALEKKYDYLFLVDSDLVLPPNLIEQLKMVDKEIVSEIFWCSWHTGMPALPNVWMFDEYDFVSKQAKSGCGDKFEKIANERFLNKLRHPGVYEVGGLGACTLIRKSALEKGVNFNPIKNLSIQGEDRFFCIRAAVLGIELFVDTHYPAYHIYREADLSGVPKYIAQCKCECDFQRKHKPAGNKITLSMIVKNEEGRYLKQMLQSLSSHIEEAVIIDDGSTDNTIQICKECLADIPLYMIENKKSMFEQEGSLREKQWEETIKTNPDWILNLDADEILEESFWEEKQRLLDDERYDVYAFRLYDMWNDTCYREDTYWNAHMFYRAFLIRFQPGFPYRFHDIPQHCGRFPMNIFLHPKRNLEYKVQHFGWATEESRQIKKERYQLLDPDAIYGISEQYDSIMDKVPTLKEFRL